MLYNALHIGDQLLSVASVMVQSASDAQKLIRGATSLYVSKLIFVNCKAYSQYMRPVRMFAVFRLLMELCLYGRVNIEGHSAAWLYPV
jgi:hypothetical protein